MIIYQYTKGLYTKGITKAFSLETNEYYKNVFENFIKSDIPLKLKVGIGIAVCSQEDAFNKKIGRNLALGRIISELVDIGDIKICLNFISFNVYSNRHDFSFEIRFLKDFTGTPRIYRY